MACLDLMIVLALALAGWFGQRRGVLQLSTGLGALPASLGLAFVLYGAAAALFGAWLSLSPLSARMLAFAALLLVAMFVFTPVVAKSYAVSDAVNRWGGLALASWSAFITCCIALVFIANYPGGRAAVAGSLVWRMLQALRVV